jgi:homoserine O-succinyltransferase
MATENVVSIALINIMPRPEKYKKLLFDAIDLKNHSVEFIDIRLRSHNYDNNGDDLNGYLPFEECIANGKPNTIIITGAPLEQVPYDEIPSWPEIQKILRYAEDHAIPVMGICFGGLLLAAFLGVAKCLLPEKAFGVCRVACDPDVEPYVGPGISDIPLAISTWALLEQEDIRGARDGGLKTLLSSDAYGPLMLSGLAGTFLIVLGHPEYSGETLKAEWMRDSVKGISYTKVISEDILEAQCAELSDAPKRILSNWTRLHAAPAIGEKA